jgi:cobalt/nickel transport system permease protein
MPDLNSALYEIGRLDRLAYQDTPIHRLDPRAKVLTTLIFLVCVVSFDKYAIVPMVPFVLFPVAMASRGEVPFDLIGKRLLLAAPFAVLVGVFNPLLDQSVVAQIGNVEIIGGWVSYISIMMRFLLTTAAAITLIATTGFNSVCMALERMGTPDVLATQLLFLYRYIFVLAEEALSMARARALRSFDGHGMGITVFGQILGHLLLRTYARAQRIYSAMLVRGFDGHIRSRAQLKIVRADVLFMLGWSSAFLFFRFVNVPLALGTLFTEAFS